MMMLLFEFRWFLSLLPLRRFFRYAFVWLIVRSSSLSDPFLENKCSMEQFKILSAHVWAKIANKYSLQVLRKFHKSTESNSSRESSDANKKEWIELLWKISIEWKMPSINQIVSTIRFSCSSFRSFRPVVLCIFSFFYKPLKWFLKCAFAMKLIQKKLNYNNIIPLIKKYFMNFKRTCCREDFNMKCIFIVN